MMLSLCLELQNLSMRTLGNVLECTQGLHGMGLIVVTIELFSLVLQQPILIGWD